MNLKYLNLRAVWLVAVLSITVLGGCKKMELRKKEKDLSRTWVISEAYLNGGDVTTQYTGWAYTFTEAGKVDVSWPYPLDSVSLTGDWEFMYNNTYVRMDLTGTLNGSPYDESIYWKFLRLSDKQLWVGYLKNQDEYEFRFVKP